MRAYIIVSEFESEFLKSQRSVNELAAEMVINICNNLDSQRTIKTRALMDKVAPYTIRGFGELVYFS